MPSGGSEPISLTVEEKALLVHYRLCNDERKEVMQNIARELVKQTRTDPDQAALPANVVRISRKL